LGDLAAPKEIERGEGKENNRIKRVQSSRALAVEWGNGTR